MVEERFSRLFNKPVTIERIHLSWPLRLQVDNLLIPKVFSAKHVSFNLGFLFSSSPQVVLTDVLVQEPVIYYVSSGRGADTAGGGDAAALAAENNNSSLHVSGGQSTASWRVLVRNLLLRKGQFFYQGSGAATPVQFKISEMDLQAENVTYPPEPQKVLFDLQGRLISARLPFSGNLVRLKGWLDYPALSMDARAKVLQKEGAEGMVAQIKSVNNDMQINGKLNLGLLGREMERKPVDAVSLGDMVLGSLQSSGLEFAVDFEIKTQMNNIRFDKMNFSGNLVKVEDLLPAAVPALP